MPSVHLVNVSKRYGEIEALDEVNLRIEDGEYVCFIGPSGCGKTTLMKCIAGITEPTEGEVYIAEELVNDVPIQERGIGYVFQEIALFPHMTVYDNVAYGPVIRGLSALETRSLVDDMISMMALRERINDPPRVLSGGAQQKTAIARALASGSHLLLLDEPLGSLDAKVRTMLRLELRKMIKDLGLTAVHVTHDQEEAMAVADKIVVMKAGRIVEVGTPLALYFRPKRLFTANFVGEANFMVGEILEKSGDSVKVKVESGIISSFEAVDFREEEKVVVAVRPEFVVMLRSGTGKGSWSGKIERKAFAGCAVRYEVRTEGGEQVIVKRPYVSDADTWEVGDRLNLDFPPQSVLLYPYPEMGLEKEISIE